MPSSSLHAVSNKCLAMWHSEPDSMLSLPPVTHQHVGFFCLDVKQNKDLSELVCANQVSSSSLICSALQKEDFVWIPGL